MCRIVKQDILKKAVDVENTAKSDLNKTENKQGESEKTQKDSEKTSKETETNVSKNLKVALNYYKINFLLEFVLFVIDL